MITCRRVNLHPAGPRNPSGPIAPEVQAHGPGFIPAVGIEADIERILDDTLWAECKNRRCQEGIELIHGVEHAVHQIVALIQAQRGAQ